MAAKYAQRCLCHVKDFLKSVVVAYAAALDNICSLFGMLDVS